MTIEEQITSNHHDQSIITSSVSSSISKTSSNNDACSAFAALFPVSSIRSVLAVDFALPKEKLEIIYLTLTNTSVLTLTKDLPLFNIF